jgi:hypothetical protein
MPDYPSIFEHMVRMDEGFDAYDRASSKYAQGLVIEFEAHFPDITREQRLKIASFVTERDLDSFKQLLVGEIRALKDMLKNRYFVAEMKEVFCGK